MDSTEFDPKKFERSIIEKVKIVLHMKSDELDDMRKKMGEMQSRIEMLERHSAIYTMTRRISKLEEVITGITEG